MKDNFDLKKFLVENKITTNSRILVNENEHVQLSDEAWKEIAGAIKAWTPEDLGITTDHLLDILVQSLEMDGIQIPEGGFKSKVDDEIIKISTELHSGQLTIGDAVKKAVAIARNPENYVSFRDLYPRS